MATRQSLRTRSQVGAVDENVSLPGKTVGGGLKPQVKQTAAARAARAPLQTLGNKNQTFQANTKAAAKQAAAATEQSWEARESRFPSVLQSVPKQDVFAAPLPVQQHVLPPLPQIDVGYVEESSEDVFHDPMETDSYPSTSTKSMMSLVDDFGMELVEIPDIDKDDLAFPEYCSEYVKPIYDYLWLRQEEFTVSEHLFTQQTEITPKMRGVLIDWLVDVHLKFKLMHETLFLTVNIIDRYLSMEQVKRDKLQLVGVVSMLIASKFEEIWAPEVRDFVYITDQAYQRHELLDMERHILNTFKFKLGVPLSLHFLRRMSKSADATPQTHTLAKYFLELTLTSTTMLKYLPSQIAAASLCLALKMLNMDWTPTISYYARATEEEITPCLLDLFELVKKAPNSRFQASRRKYGQKRFYSVATIADMQANNVVQSE
eukprot:comp24003_c0_seq1/m.42773 comp24003_c0_seq1/g.42773  ORF comp24003_c0_seq1/g.42773 comp24003_c0_seq1/m.42773 type:complete len:431 (-) comp24003_c0_seq1:709-2001(-)